MIKPTVGRVLWFWPSPEDRCARIEGQPLAAIVAHAWSDTCVNLAYFDANGVHRHKTSVLLVQEGAQRPAAGFAEWMPYQKGQAAKTEAVQREALTRCCMYASRSSIRSPNCAGPSRSVAPLPN
ncbi:hypothetical protein ACP3P8_23205 [Pseudomonas aeruginosa]